MNYLLLDQSEITKLLSSEVNHDAHARIKYFYPQYMDSHTHFLSIDEDSKITGILAISPDMAGNDNCYHIEYVSVDPEFKNQGISKNLINLLVSFASKNDFSLKYGQVSEEASNYFIENLRSACLDNNVVLL